MIGCDRVSEVVRRSLDRRTILWGHEFPFDRRDPSMSAFGVASIRCLVLGGEPL
jgi:hypothetical protein